MTKKLSIETTKNQEFIDITKLVNDTIRESGVQEGTAVVFIPHTTAGITINENSDPDVMHDILLGLNKAFPEGIGYRHREGNSHAHIRASAFGSSITLVIENGELMLGTWQGIYFCEFDGPRVRDIIIKLLKG